MEVKHYVSADLINYSQNIYLTEKNKHMQNKEIKAMIQLQRYDYNSLFVKLLV